MRDEGGNKYDFWTDLIYPRRRRKLTCQGIGPGVSPACFFALCKSSPQLWMILPSKIRLIKKNKKRQNLVYSHNDNNKYYMRNVCKAVTVFHF